MSVRQNPKSPAGGIGAKELFRSLKKQDLRILKKGVSENTETPIVYYALFTGP